MFGSGTPQPTNDNYNWTLNDGPLNDDDYFNVEPTRIALETTIQFEISGVYRNVLTTSAGVRSAEIQLNVEGEREGGREGEREGGRERGREGGRERGREGGREGGN